MSFFRTNKDKNSLPSAGQSSKQTKKRKTIDWQLNLDPVDGPVRQGTKGDKITRDANQRPILLAADLCTLIRENFNAYIQSLAANPRRYYSGVAHVVTGRTKDERKFARLEVQKGNSETTTTSTVVFALSIARTRIRAMNGLHFVTTKLFEQDSIHYDPSIKFEHEGDEGDEGDAETIWGDDTSEMDGAKGS